MLDIERVKDGQQSEPNPATAEMRQAIEDLAAKQPAETTPTPEKAVLNQEFEVAIETVHADIRSAALEYGEAAEKRLDDARSMLDTLDMHLADAPPELEQSLRDISALARRELDNTVDDQQTKIADPHADKVRAAELLSQGFGYSKDNFAKTADTNKLAREVQEDLNAIFRNQVGALVEVDQDFGAFLATVGRMTFILDDQAVGGSANGLARHIQDYLRSHVLPELRQIQLDLDDSMQAYRITLEQHSTHGMDIADGLK